ncbi:DUF167-domain-containing protein [Xylaria palmicola]|nr:DUF167-domain-containing protein [Xylaria palmicola]
MSARAAISIAQRKSSAGPALQLRCHVRPGASKTREGVVAITDDAIELCVSAPPQDGKANKAVLELLSKTLGLPKSDLKITTGLKSRDKVVSVENAFFTRSESGEVIDIVKFVKERLRPIDSAQ